MAGHGFNRRQVMAGTSGLALTGRAVMPLAVR